jgi:tagaturonate reductase
MTPHSSVPPRLDRRALTDGVPHTPGAPRLPVSVLQFGDGNFLRAFVDWMIDCANEAGATRAGVAIVQPLAQGIAPLLRDQDNLYTVLLRGTANGAPVASRRVVSCVQAALNPHDDWSAVVALATDPALRVVVSNTTEAGIADSADSFDPDRCPQGFPAKIATLLYARYRALGDTPDSGLLFLPCELIEANGANLKRLVLRLAERWGLGHDFMAWVETRNHFLNTLVDRIVPGYPAAEIDRLSQDWGYADRLAVAAEPFHVWVIEGPAALAEILPLHQAGLNVVWTSSLAPYRTRKVRILNGAHTASVLAAFCAGLDTVQAMTDDPVVSAFLEAVMFREIVPFVPLPEAERQDYARTILERFSNPHIRHDLIAIALNSVSKWTVRVLPTIKDYAARTGSVPGGLAFSLAALLWFYRGRLENGACTGARAEGPYPIRDTGEILERMAAAWAAADPANPAPLVSALLADAHLWGEDLTALPGLALAVTRGLADIAVRGVKPAMAAVTAALPPAPAP